MISTASTDSAEGTAAEPPSTLDRWVAALAMAAQVDQRPDRVFGDVVAELASIHGDAPAVLSDRESYTFRQLADGSARYARWALAQGIRPGERVALLMPNRPEYLAAWIGISRVGGVVALLNTHLTGAALAHSVAAAAPAHAIVAAELLPSWQGAASLLPAGLAPVVWLHGDADAALPRLDLDLLGRSGEPLSEVERGGVTTADPALLIYTSGTTGLPKAARVSHHRVMMWSHWFAGMMMTTPLDRMYDCLPLYHSVGGIVATGSVLVNGGSVVIAERFSVTRFWDEIQRWDCTLFQYIGELCRYLVKAPPSGHEGDHRLRMVCGNGLRVDVWEPFKSRFAIPQILEFYAATEGNFSLYNVEGKPGAIGRIPSFMAARFPAAIVKHDPSTGLPLRDETGFCLRCARDEPGEAIGRISADEVARAGRFEGYTNVEDTDRKVLRDVFKPGDAWFRTGDLMRMDRQGFFTFVDRLGDTFRWKGENVATTEVAAAIASCPGIVDAVVFGVAVPHHDGRAGMAALVVTPDFESADLRQHLGTLLPAYARPLFLRLCARFEMTETFKQKTVALATAGFDPALVQDPLLFDDMAQGAYVPLDVPLQARIARGELRL
ncbi:long-chain-acyl-CoA synthetase [Lichenihabitans psoromatis]|uniref:long-chain-acyl-CoA synthetase n=1 Tax=Lichenihabitans psoromatis TaxID=2528642 RepID=UPI001036B038|nr:long-chain-acyl-CoA synthetase [Lichenihabitans psoromatis]